MARALSSDATSTAPPTAPLASYLTGACGLLFTPRSPPAVLKYFASFTPLDFARAGTPASRSFTLPAGALYSRGGELPPEDDVLLQHSTEPALRKLGLPTRMEKGNVVLNDAFEVCKEGEVLGSGQTSLLKMFGVAMAEFRVGVRAYWTRETEEVTAVEGIAGLPRMDLDEESDGTKDD